MSVQKNYFSYETIFTIESEHHLEDFWAYLIFKLNLERSEAIYDRFARLYNLMYEYKNFLLEDNHIIIRLQESTDLYCLTFNTTLHSLINTIIQRLELLKLPYHYENDVLKYSINKKVAKPTQTQIQPVHIYDFIDKEDLLHMSDILEKMQERNYEKFNQYFSLEELNDFRTTFSYYASYLNYYPQVHSIANVVAELAVILSLYPDKCIAVGENIRMMLRAFVNNLYYWQEKYFIHGTDDQSLMFDSFYADLSQIKIILELYDNTDTDTDDLDSIFNF